LYIYFFLNVKLTLRYGIFIVLTLFFASCQEEKETNLSFSFSAPLEGQFIWNTTPVQLNLPSSFSGSIELKLGAQTIGTITQRPYQFNWNTRSLPDGEYTLQAVATSFNGEKQEIIQRVIIRNHLLTLDVAANQIPSGMRGFIFLSDAGGNIIAQTEFKNGDRIAMMGPEKFNDPTFIVNEAYVTYPNYLQVYSVGAINRGRWTLNKPESGPSFVGSIQVKSENASNTIFYVSASGDADFIRENSNNLFLATTKSPSQLFMREVKDFENRYAIIKNVSAGSSLTFPIEKITTPLQTLKIALPDPKLISARVKLFGFPQTDTFAEYYRLGDFFQNSDQIEIEYPDKEFASIGSESYYRNDKIRLYSFNPTKLYDFKPLKAEVAVASTDGKLVSLATYGDFDIYSVSWMYFDEFTRGFGLWSMIGPTARSQNLQLPSLPAEISNLVPLVKTKELTFTGAVQVSDYAALNGYASYVDFITRYGIAGPYKFGNAWKEQLFTESGFTAGRTRFADAPMLVEQLKIVSTQ
jgi:hypothetical protein